MLLSLDSIIGPCSVNAIACSGIPLFDRSHRLWLAERLQSIPEYVAELDVVKNWTSKHISDYSSFSYRQYLLQQCHDRSVEVKRDARTTMIILTMR